MTDVPLFRLDAVRYLDYGPISLCLKAGECVAVQGISGTGKTLLLKIMADLLPHEGTLFLSEKPSTEYSPQQWRRQVALLFSTSQWWLPTVQAHFSRIPTQELKDLNLTPDILEQPPQSLSTGQLQRLALLRLLLNEPKVLLLDEPTAHLDPTNAMCLENYLQAYQQRMEATLIWVSHDEKQVARMAQRVFYFDNGVLKNGRD